MYSIIPIDIGQPSHIIFVRQPLAEVLYDVVKHHTNMHCDEQKEPRRSGERQYRRQRVGQGSEMRIS